MTSTHPSIAENGLNGAWQPGTDGLVTAASFWSPMRSGVGSGWIEHAPFAFWIMGAMRPRCFAELGSYMGYSYSAFCQAAQRLGTGTVCHAVDTWAGDDHAGFYGDEVFNDLQAFNAQHFSSFSRLVRSTFSEASRHFADASIDLLHIDGRHGYDDVKADYEEWEPKLAPGAVVLFHDTNVRERGFGVFRFWSEISRDRPHFEFLHGNGLGVLGSHETRSPQIRALFAAEGDEAAEGELRTAYASLGGALADAYGLQSLRGDAEAAHRMANEQQNRLVELQRERDAFEDGCRERDAMVMRFQERAADLAREKAAFEDGCRERDVEIIRLRLQVAELSSPTSFKDENKDTALVEALRDQIATHDRELARLLRNQSCGSSPG